MVPQKTRRNVVVQVGFLQKATDFIVPRFCLHCDSLLPFNVNFLCEDCLSKECVLSKTEREELRAEKFEKELVAGIFSISRFSGESPYRDAIHSLKYGGVFDIGKYLGGLIAETFSDKFSDLFLDYIIPVPLHRLRLIERGYNQSSEIAKGISKISKIKILANNLKRIRHTEAQVKTESREERHRNIKGAFKVTKQNLIQDKNILLVDDVITTGSTIAEIAKELHNSGASTIYASSILIA
jgi:ComF family protein